MVKVNFHAHTTASDGKLSAEQVIEEAIKDKIDFLCITDHYPAPENLDPYGKDFFKEGHFENLTKLKEKYKEKINISIGVEFDWINGFDEWYKKEISKKPYDFLIGSVHALFTKDNTLSGFWDKKEDLKKFIEKIGGSKKYVKEYYVQVRNMVKSNLFDCVGHLDIIKINNQNNSLFSETDEWYKKEILKTLDLIAKEKMAIEVNSRGLVKGDEQYPSKFILIEARKRNIPLTVGTDFHAAGENEPYLGQLYKIAKEAGYAEICIFKKRKQIEVPLD
ncbi:MAG: histidinol-phosphatase HisJ family protein [archaeon]|jgi:histidinol-phosphatase (PHP family)